VIEHATRRIRILAVTLLPTGEWTAQQARNLLVDLGEQTHRVKFVIRDRGPNFTTAFEAVLADAGIRTVLCNVRTPRMNAIAERWIGGCRRGLPHRSLHGAAPLNPLFETVDLEHYRVRRPTRVGGLISEYRLVA
jgi:putative transposase